MKRGLLHIASWMAFNRYKMRAWALSQIHSSNNFNVTLYAIFRNRYVMMTSFIAIALLLWKVRLASEFLPVKSAFAFFIALKLQWLSQQLNQVTSQYVRLKVSRLKWLNTSTTMNNQLSMVMIFYMMTQVIWGLLMIGTTLLLSDDLFITTLILVMTFRGMLEGWYQIKLQMILSHQRIKQNIWTVYGAPVLEAILLTLGFVLSGPLAFLWSPIFGVITEIFIIQRLIKPYNKIILLPSFKSVFGSLKDISSHLPTIPFSELRQFYFPRALRILGPFILLLMTIFMVFQHDPIGGYSLALLLAISKSIGTTCSRFSKAIVMDIQKSIETFKLIRSYELITSFTWLLLPSFLFAGALWTLLYQFNAFDWMMVHSPVYLTGHSHLFILAAVLLITGRLAFQPLFLFYPNRWAPALLMISAFIPALVLSTHGSHWKNVLLIWCAGECFVILYSIKKSYFASWLIESPFIARSFQVNRNWIQKKGAALRDQILLGWDTLSGRLQHDPKILWQHIANRPNLSRSDLYLLQWSKLEKNLFERPSYRAFIQSLRISDFVFELPNRDLIIITHDQSSLERDQMTTRIMAPILHVINKFEHLFLNEKTTAQEVLKWLFQKQAWEETPLFLIKKEKTYKKLKTQISKQRLTFNQLPLSFTQKWAVGTYQLGTDLLILCKKSKIVPLIEKNEVTFSPCKKDYSNMQWLILWNNFKEGFFSLQIKQLQTSLQQSMMDRSTFAYFLIQATVLSERNHLHLMELDLHPEGLEALLKQLHKQKVNAYLNFCMAMSSNKITLFAIAKKSSDLKEVLSVLHQKNILALRWNQDTPQGVLG